MTQVEVSVHSYQRTKERVGKKGKNANRTIEKAFKYGADINCYKQGSQEKEYLKAILEKSNQGCFVRIYNYRIFIFSNESVCVTVLKAPEYFYQNKKIQYLGKLKLRNPAKYLRNYYDSYSFENAV